MAYSTFLDSFDHYATADLLQKWASKSGTVEIDADGGRRNSGGLVITPGAGARVLKSVSASSHITMGFAVKVAAAEVTADKMNILAALWNNNTPQLLLTILPSTYYLQVWRHEYNGTWPDRNAAVLLGTSVNPLTLDSWQHLELGVYLNNTGTFELRVNGSNAVGIAETNADTYYTGVCNAVSLGAPPLGGSAGQQYYGLGTFDDLRVAFGDELAWKGDRRIDYIDLSADSSPQDWTVSTGNAWEALNGNGENIQSSTVGHVSRFELANLGFTPNIIDTVQIVAQAQKSDSGNRAVSLLSARYTEGWTEDSSADSYLTEALAMHTAEFPTDPVTGVAWTESGLNEMVVGVELTV